MKVTVDWRQNRFPAIQKRLPGAMGEISLEIAQGVADDAKATVPVQTGALRDSIVAEAEGRSGAVAYTELEYAPYVEFGHEGRAPQPFFMQASEDHRNDPAMGTLEERL